MKKEKSSILISVITVSYNSSETIEDTITSVMNQSIHEYEHLIIDGESTDNTLEICSKYPHLKIFSEPDNGIYDAMNKGIIRSRGKYILWLNSDDYLLDNDVLKNVFEDFENADIIMSGIKIINPITKKIIRLWNPSMPSKFKIFLGWLPAHPSFIVKKSIVDRVGGYDVKYSVSADYGFMIRCIENSKNIITKRQTMTIMRSGGLSNSGIKSRIVIINDIWNQMFELKYYNFLYPFTKWFFKINQILRF